LQVKKIPAMMNWDSLLRFYLAFRQQTLHFEVFHYRFFGQDYISLALRREDFEEL
jgi:hypothetical protein